jgi:hypothetical protein
MIYDESKYIIIGRIFESEIILIPPSLKISESSSNGSYRNMDEVWRYGISQSCDECDRVKHQDITPINRYVFAPISFHPCVKLRPEQSWHHFKIKKWPITNYALIFYEKYSTSLSTIVLVVLTTANFGGFSNFCRYYTWSQAGKSTGYRPTLKPLCYDK